MANWDSVSWSDLVGYRGFDIHLVRQAGADSTTGPLLPMLALDFVDEHGETTTEAMPHPGFTVVFALTVPKPAAGYRSRFDFDLVPADGTITLSATPSANVVHNFIVIATVTETATGKVLSAKIRVHLHAGLTALHLEPSLLRIHAGTSARFSLLAEFQDQTVGDVSYHPGTVWSVDDGPLQVSNGAPTDDVPPGYFKTTSAGPATGHVKATLPANLGGTSKSGQVGILPAWDRLPGTAPYQATLITGPGTVERSQPDVRNVLFLPEGFTSGQRTLFEQLADGMALTELSVSKVFRPFDLLKERINYYRLWIEPSGDEGVTELNDLAPLAGAGPGFHGALLPTPEEPSSSGIEKIEHLVYKVGLPAPNDTFPATVQAQITAWNGIYGAGFVAFAGTADADAIFTEWRNLQSYGVVLESDTLFGLAMGERPQIDHRSKSNFIQYHPFRADRDEVDVLLGKIQALDEVAKVPVTIGADLWVAPGSKDLGSVCFICLGGRSVGTHFSSKDKLQIAVTMTDLDEPAVAATSVGAFYSELADIPKTRRRQRRIKVPKSQVAALAHELAHDMTCGDEYGGKGQSLPSSQKSRLDQWWNLQDADELAGTDPSVRILDERIRWRWPRVLKAGFMERALEPDGADFKVKMRVTYGEKFAVGDKVRFRDARLLVSAPASSDPSDPTLILKFQPPPYLFQVTAKAASDPDLLSLKLLPLKPGTPPFTNTSLPGNILYQPMLDANDDDILIVHKSVLAQMRTFGPLSRLLSQAACDPTLSSNDDPQTPPRLPDALKAANLKKAIRNRRAILGLYDGGLVFRCGVYHASGECMMRRYSFSVDTNGESKRVVTPFCHVCRYIMVDKLDPRQHARINLDFAYPETKS